MWGLLLLLPEWESHSSCSISNMLHFCKRPACWVVRCFWWSFESVASNPGIIIWRKIQSASAMTPCWNGCLWCHHAFVVYEESRNWIVRQANTHSLGIELLGKSDQKKTETAACTHYLRPHITHLQLMAERSFYCYYCIQQQSIMWGIMGNKNNVKNFNLISFLSEADLLSFILKTDEASDQNRKKKIWWRQLSMRRLIV